MEGAVRVNFNLKYYRVFVAVYENKSMSIAAEKLFFSQPAVSRIIREMELAYNTRFFHRHAGQLQYTESGKKFYRYAKQLLEVEEQLDNAMQEQRKLFKVYIGATPTLANYYLPDIINRYHQECGHLDIYLRTLPNSGMEEILKTSRLDFVLAEGINPTYELEVRHIADDKLVFVTGDPSTVTEPIPILLRDLGEGARQRMEGKLFDAQIPFLVRGEFTDVDGIKQYASRNMGVGIIPRGTLLPGDRLQEVDLPNLNMDMSISMAYYRKKYMFPELRELMTLMETWLRERLE